MSIKYSILSALSSFLRIVLGLFLGFVWSHLPSCSWSASAVEHFPDFLGSDAMVEGLVFAICA